MTDDTLFIKQPEVSPEAKKARNEDMGIFAAGAVFGTAITWLGSIIVRDIFGRGR